MKGTGPYAQLIARRFHLAVRRLGLNAPVAAARSRQIPAPAPARRAIGAALGGLRDASKIAVQFRKKISDGFRLPSGSARLAGMPDYSHEARILAATPGPLAGIDEVGRGPLAGPVVAAAVILDKATHSRGAQRFQETDAAKKREALCSTSSWIARSSASVRPASKRSMRSTSVRPPIWPWRAPSRHWQHAPAIALVDGKDAPALTCPCETLIGGDGLSVSIAAASIIAKVTRDRMMARTACGPPRLRLEHQYGLRHRDPSDRAKSTRAHNSSSSILCARTQDVGVRESGGVTSVSFLSHT